MLQTGCHKTAIFIRGLNMSKFTIPTVSLKDYLSNDEARNKKFIDTVGMALSEIGFFALSDHNLSDEEIAVAYEKSKDFFALSNEVKKSYVVPGIQGQRGFTAFGVEHAKDHDAPDLKEFWHIGQELSLSKIFQVEDDKNRQPVLRDEQVVLMITVNIDQAQDHILHNLDFPD